MPWDFCCGKFADSHHQQQPSPVSPVHENPLYSMVRPLAPAVRPKSNSNSNSCLNMQLVLSSNQVVPPPSCATQAKGFASFWLTPIDASISTDTICPTLSVGCAWRFGWWVRWHGLTSDIPSFPGITLNKALPGRNGPVLLNLSNTWFVQSAHPTGFGRDDGNCFAPRVFRRLFLPNEGQLAGELVIPDDWTRQIKENQTYLTISSENNPDGELRGQLVW